MNKYIAEITENGTIDLEEFLDDMDAADLHDHLEQAYEAGQSTNVLLFFLGGLVYFMGSLLWLS